MSAFIAQDDSRAHFLDLAIASGGEDELERV
jgi:hypothetical protein